MPMIKTLVCTGLLAASAAAHALDCANAVSTVDMNACAVEDQKKVEQELNDTYRKVLGLMPAAVGEGPRKVNPKTSLVAAQRVWVKFREADCKAVYELWSDGSARDLQRLGCMKAHAVARTQQLKAMVERP